VIHGQILDSAHRNGCVVRPPCFRRLRAPPIGHVKPWRNGDAVPINGGDSYELLLRAIRAPIGGAGLLRTDIDCLTDPDRAVIGRRIVKLIKDQRGADFQIRRAAQRNRRRACRIAAGPCRQIPRIAGPVPITVEEADIRAHPSAAASGGEHEERLIGAGSSECDIALVVEADARGERVRAGVEKDDLPTPTRGDRRVDLRRRRPRIERGADRGAMRNAAGYACLTPVNPSTRGDDRLGLGVCSKTQQKGGQTNQVFASHIPKWRKRSADRTCVSARAQASGGPQVTGGPQN